MPEPITPEEFLNACTVNAEVHTCDLQVGA